MGPELLSLLSAPVDLETFAFRKKEHYLSFTCHLKCVFGPQSEWSRKKLPSLDRTRKKDHTMAVNKKFKWHEKTDGIFIIML